MVEGSREIGGYLTMCLTLMTLYPKNLFDFFPIDWAAVAVISALTIAVVGDRRSKKTQEESKKREAIEKLLTPIRKELDGFSKSRWDNWLGNHWEILEERKLDFPLQYYWLKKANSDVVNSIAKFDVEFERFNSHTGTEIPEVIKKLIIDSVKSFFKEKTIEIHDNAGQFPSDNEIFNSHWRCRVGGKAAAVTLRSLVMWKESLTDYLNDRKQDEEIAGPEVSKVEFSMSGIINFSPEFNEQLSNELLLYIEANIFRSDQNAGIECYRKQWQELYNRGSKLLNQIDTWLSTQ